MSNDVTFERGNGALGRPLPSFDHISALCMPITTVNLPAGFAADDRIKKVYSLGAAEALGVVSTDANLAHTHYQVSEFFRMNPKGVLYIYLYDDTTSDAGVYLQPVIEYPENGEIRQAAVFIDDGITTAELDEMQVVAEAMQALHRPFSVIASFSDFADDYDWSAAPDLRTSENNLVSCVVGCSSSGAGAALAAGSNNIPGLGAVLGAVSLASVHESIAWVRKFNFSDGTELETLGLGHKDILVNDLSTTLLDALVVKGYIFFKKHLGISGSYASDSPTNDLSTSDYAFIENQRTIDKAVRNVRTFLLPELSSPVYLNADGTLREDTVAYITSLAERPLDTMEQNGEVSASEVTIDPTQDILATSKLTVGIKIVPVGVARQIEVKIAFALKVGA